MEIQGLGGHSSDTNKINAVIHMIHLRHTRVNGQ